MKRLTFFLVLACICTGAFAQDLKPVKDKDSKLFGYQDGAKNWVIEPQFDKAKKFDHDIAIVTKDKTEGVISVDGSFVIPIECNDVKIDYKRCVICAERFFEVETPEEYNAPYACAWGVYDFSGNEIFAPQFDSRPTFNGDGVASAKDRGTRMAGIISADGDVLVPFDYYFAYVFGNGFRALDPSMQVVKIASDGRVEVDKYAANAPWLPLPYDPDHDVVRAFAYGHNMIGLKVYKNGFWSAKVQTDDAGKRAQLMLSPAVAPDGHEIEWGRGYSNFVRLELAKDSARGTFEYPKTGDKYTVQLNLYDGSGRFVQNLSEWGRIMGAGDEGVIYEAEDELCYFVSFDVNWPNEPIAVTMRHFVAVPEGSFRDALALTDRDCGAMSDYWASKSIFTDVDLAEKSGYQSYIPFSGPAPFSDGAHLVATLETKYPFLRKKFYAENVYTMVKGSVKEGNASITVKPGYIAHYHDDYGDSFTLDTDEPVFWGVRRDRYVRIMLDTFPISSAQRAEPAKVDGVVNDLNDKNLAVRFVFALFEDDGTFIRIIGRSPKLDFIGPDLIGFSGAGIVFSRRRPEFGAFKYRETAVISDMVSEFGSVDY